MFMKRLKAVRTANGLTQKDLADKLNITAPAIVAWEKGRTEPDLKTVITICSIFNITADYLLGISDKIEKHSLKLDEKDNEKTLTEREVELIELYRQLPSDEQLILLGEVKGMAKVIGQHSAALEQSAVS